MMKSRVTTISVNGKKYFVRTKAYDTLLRVLREEVGLTGTKKGCDYGGCGACTVLVNDTVVYSCMYPVDYCVGKDIVTIEGLAERYEIASIIQKEFELNGGFQCGYCTPGILVSTLSLFLKNKNPSLDEIKEGLSGNICRCTGYEGIIRSINSVIKILNETEEKIYNG